MTVAELEYGRGTQASAFEISIGWPLYLEWKHRTQEEQQRKADDRAKVRTFGRVS